MPATWSPTATPAYPSACAKWDPRTASCPELRPHHRDNPNLPHDPTVGPPCVGRTGTLPCFEARDVRSA